MDIGLAVLGRIIDDEDAEFGNGHGENSVGGAEARGSEKGVSSNAIKLPYRPFLNCNV
jgi:hypothetical protein